MEMGNTKQAAKETLQESNVRQYEMGHEEMHNVLHHQQEIAKEIKKTKSVISQMDINDSDRPSLMQRIEDLEKEMIHLEEKKKQLEAELASCGGDPAGKTEPKRFDKYRCFRNIRFLLEKKGAKLGDIERASGNSAGYMSRLEKEANTTDPSMEFMVTAANMLGVKLDDLVFGNFTELSPNEEALLGFLNRLAYDTRKDEQEWEKETFKQHEKYEDWTGPQDHPHCLYIMGVEYDDDGSCYSPGYYTYGSKFFPFGHIVIGGDSFHTEINSNGDMLYLMDCIDKDESGDHFYEIYHLDRNSNIHAVCCTRYKDDQIRLAVERLHDQIEESLSHVRLSEETKDMIMVYMELKGE